MKIMVSRILKLKSGGTVEASYDNNSNVITIDGRKSDEFEPAFIPSGEKDAVDFFGWVEKKTQTCYDIYGGQSLITNENDIKI